ncbi:MAG: hypothetical protein Ct9H90mP9_3010 [Pseudomonadota bacterium]|nr:MAG: hypothetical protein Ct9H90mP9_3010 [Pseudomonadota bacterium]
MGFRKFHAVTGKFQILLGIALLEVVSYLIQLPIFTKVFFHLLVDRSIQEKG